MSSYIGRNSPRRAASTLLALLVTLSACGEDPAAVDDYANDVCTALVGWTDELRQRQAELQEGSTPGGSPEEDKEAFERFVEGAVAASDALADDLNAAGEPDVENGDEAAGALRGAAEETREELEDAQADVAELPTDSPASYRAAVDELVTDLRATLEEAAASFREVDAPELDRALDEASACEP